MQRATSRWRLSGFGALLALLAACPPSKFDGLSGGKRVQAGDDASVLAEDGMDGGEEGDAEADHDAASEETGPSDAAGDAAGTAGDAGPEAGNATASDAGKDAGDAEAGTARCMPSTTARPLRVTTDAIELARLLPPKGVSSRNLGATVQLGTTRIWTFEGTALTVPETRPVTRADNYPSSARDGASQPWSETKPSGEWRLSDTLDARNMPENLLPLNTAEQALTNIGIFVSALVRDPNQTNGAIGFARKGVGFFQPFSESWFVRMTSGSSIATRGVAPLFVSPEPLFGQAAVRDGNYFKVFACASAGPDAGAATAFPCKVARVPIARASERAAYEFYARDTFGAGEWTSDVMRAAPVVNATDFAFSVSFNEYLHQFLLVHGGPASNTVSLRTAALPEGPWSEAVIVKQSVPPYWFNLNTREHDSLAQNCGKRIVISTWSPKNGSDVLLPSEGDVVLSAIDLQ